MSFSGCLSLFLRASFFYDLIFQFYSSLCLYFLSSVFIDMQQRRFQIFSPRPSENGKCPLDRSLVYSDHLTRRGRLYIGSTGCVFFLWHDGKSNWFWLGIWWLLKSFKATKVDVSKGEYLQTQMLRELLSSLKSSCRGSGWVSWDSDQHLMVTKPKQTVSSPGLL